MTNEGRDLVVGGRKIYCLSGTSFNFLGFWLLFANAKVTRKKPPEREHSGQSPREF